MKRRTFLFASAAAAAVVNRPAGTLIDTHIHLYAPNAGFPYHKNDPYRSPQFTLEQYIPFIKQAGINHTIFVSPEGYQDDHRYLEYCFQHEPSPGYFKGTCLFDTLDPATPARMAELVKRNPKRIAALRIHQMNKPGTPYERGGAIRNRDMSDPQMKKAWAAANNLGIAVQMHFLPYYAPAIGKLAREFPSMPVLLDHLGRAGQGTPQDFDEVLKLAKLPNTYIKFSGIRHSSKEGHPYRDLAPIIRRSFDAYGPGRMLWGGLGKTEEEFAKAVEAFEVSFAFASEQDRARIRGLNAARVFKF